MDLNSVVETVGSHLQTISSQLESLVSNPAKLLNDPAAMLQVQKFFSFLSVFATLGSGDITVHTNIAKTIIHNMTS